MPDYDLMIGAKKEHLKKIAMDLLAACEQEYPAFTIHAEDNSGVGGEVRIQFSNDDMERDEVPDDCVYVDIDPV